MKRRKFIHRVSIGAISLAIPTSAYAIHTSERYMQILTSYTRNPSFSAVPGTEDYPGTPRDQKELYMNEEHVFLPKMGDLLKWQTSTNPYKAEKKDDKRRLQVIQRCLLTRRSFIILIIFLYRTITAIIVIRKVYNCWLNKIQKLPGFAD
jgi:hypothetical protein